MEGSKQESKEEKMEGITEGKKRLMKDWKEGRKRTMEGKKERCIDGKESNMKTNGRKEGKENERKKI